MDSTREQSNDFRDPRRWNSVPVPERVALRAITNVDKREDGCWISRYSVASHGYSQIGWNDGVKRHMVLGHRAAWSAVNGQVPLGMTIDHLCKERRCVNPDHLRLLPNYENARRTSGRDWPLGYCVNGHPNSDLVAGGSGHTNCGVCLNASKEKYRVKVARGEHVPVNVRNDRCKWGHDMTGDGAKRNSRGSWECVTCRRARRKKHNDKIRSSQ